MNTPLKIRIGDVLKRRKGVGLITHFGVVVGDNLILQNTPGKGEHAVTLKEFSAGGQIAVNRSNVHPNAIAHRASSLLQNPQKYDVFRNNCEHTVTKVVEGRAVSPQIAVWGLLAVLGGLIFLFSKKS